MSINTNALKCQIQHKNSRRDAQGQIHPPPPPPTHTHIPTITFRAVSLKHVIAKSDLYCHWLIAGGFASFVITKDILHILIQHIMILYKFF